MTDIPRLAPAPEPWLDGSPTVAAAKPDQNWAEWLGDQLLSYVDGVSPRTWATLMGVTFIALLVSLPWARRQAFIAGRMSTGKAKAGSKDKALFIAAMVPAGLFWLAVVAGSFRGLVAFAEDTLHWTDGWELLVPFTLDGIAISFGFLAFRAVLSNRSPDRANNMVKGASLASALINFVHEANLPQGSWLGGAYLALLSVFGVLIFHEFLDQFADGAEYIVRAKPKFGLRWITWPTNTACAWVAWQNYPPNPLPANASKDEILYWGSVQHAVAHLEDVRAQKREVQRKRDLDCAERGFKVWMHAAPWIRARQLDAVVAEQKKAAAAEAAEMQRRFNEIAEQHAAELRESEQKAIREAKRIAAEHAEETERLTAERETEQQRRTRAEQMAEQVRSGAALRMEQLRTEHAEQIRSKEAEHAEQIRSMATEHAERIRSILTEQDDRAGQVWAEQAEQLRAEHAEQLRKLQAEHTERMELLRAEHAEQLRAERARPEQPKTEQPKTEQPKTERSKTERAAGRSNVTPLAGRRSSASDDSLLAQMFMEHPGSTYEWSTREINRITNAGFSSKAPRLLDMAKTHLAGCTEDQHDHCYTKAADSSSDLTSQNALAGELATAGS